MPDKRPDVLVVEDNPINMRLMEALLDSQGFDFRGADCAYAAFEEVERRVPDLILLDIQLPGMSGLELAGRLRAGSAACVPIVGLSAYAMEADRDRALSAGCDAYFTKPVDTATFGDDLRRLLDRARAR